MCPQNHPGDPAYATGFGVPFEIQMDCAGNNISQTALNILNVKLPNGSYYLPGSTTGGFQQGFILLWIAEIRSAVASD